MFVGKEGETTTVLRPSGMADVEGIRLNVVSEGEYIPNGTKVRVVRVDGARVVVRAIA